MNLLGKRREMLYCISHPPDTLELRLYVRRKHRTGNVTDPDLQGRLSIPSSTNALSLSGCGGKKSRKMPEVIKIFNTNRHTQKYKRLSARPPSTVTQERMTPWHYLTASELWPPANLQQGDAGSEAARPGVCAGSPRGWPTPRPHAPDRPSIFRALFCFLCLYYSKILKTWNFFYFS